MGWRSASFGLIGLVLSLVLAGGAAAQGAAATVAVEGGSVAGI